MKLFKCSSAGVRTCTDFGTEKYSGLRETLAVLSEHWHALKLRLTPSRSPLTGFSELEVGTRSARPYLWSGFTLQAMLLNRLHGLAFEKPYSKYVAEQGQRRKSHRTAA